MKTRIYCVYSSIFFIKLYLLAACLCNVQLDNYCCKAELAPFLTGCLIFAECFFYVSISPCYFPSDILIWKRKQIMPLYDIEVCVPTWREATLIRVNVSWWVTSLFYIINKISCSSFIFYNLSVNSIFFIILRFILYQRAETRAIDKWRFACHHEFTL